jgi:putative FmdB family regulatory protein
MPLYEYCCLECGLAFEKMLGFSEADRLPPCPGCNSSQTRKKLSTVAWLGTSAPGPAGQANTGCSPRGGFS